MKFAAIFATIAILIAAATPAESKCLQRDFIDTWEAQGKDVVFVRQGLKEWYKLTLLGYCPGLNQTAAIAIASKFNGLCVGVGDHVIVHFGEPPGDCTITRIEPYTGPVPNHPSAGAKPQTNQSH